MRDLDFSCGGLLPLIAPLEGEPAGRDDRRDVWLTRGEIRTASLRLAEIIASERKRLVFLFCGNTCETLIGLLAAAAANHAVALIDPSLAEDKLSGLIAAYHPELILSTPDIGERLRDQLGASGEWRSFELRAGVVDWISRDAGATSVDINPALQLLLSTSGTTGSQKYVRLSRDAIVANAGQIAEALAIDERSIGIAHLPLHYSYGLSVVTSHLAAGGRVLSRERFDHLAELLVEDRQRRRIAFPRRSLSLCCAGAPGSEPCPGLVKAFTQAGGALDPRIQAKIHDWATLRGGRFFVMYGQTEASPRMTTLQHADFSRKAGSVGVALHGGRLSIVDDQGAPLPAGAIGTVVYEGPNVMLGYAMSRADLGKGDEMKGRLETGDLGRVDAEGFLYLTGRTKRFAKIAGYRLGLDEIEQELFAVCSVACFDLGEKIAVVHEQELETALKARVRELAASYKVPSSSFSLLKTAQIPRGASGKINYAQLKESLRV